MPEEIKELRFREMDETGSLMLKELNEFFKPLLKKITRAKDDPAFEEFCLAYFTEKIGNKPLRAYFSRKIFEYLNSSQMASKPKKKRLDISIFFTVKLPFIFEVIIIIQYLHNHILDEKYSTKIQHQDMVMQKLISSNILREALFAYMDIELVNYINEAEKIQYLTQQLRQLLLYVDIGQYLDKYCNTYNNWKSSTGFQFTAKETFWDDPVEHVIRPIIDQVQADVPGRDAFVEGYFRRIYLSNVYFFRCISEVVIHLLGQNKHSQKEKLVSFSINYGFMLQIINDYADFAYSPNQKEQETLATSAKKTTDLFSDLYNFNITLPLIYHLRSNGRRNIEAYLEGGRKRKKLLDVYPQQIMQEIIQSGGIRASIAISRQLSKSAQESLDEINLATPYLINMCDMAYKNKFYNIFK